MVSGLAPTGAASMARAAVLTGLVIGPVGLLCWLATWQGGNLHWLDTTVATLIVGLAVAMVALFAPARAAAPAKTIPPGAGVAAAHGTGRSTPPRRPQPAA